MQVVLEDNLKSKDDLKTQHKLDTAQLGPSLFFPIIVNRKAYKDIDFEPRQNTIIEISLHFHFVK